MIEICDWLKSVAVRRLRLNFINMAEELTWRRNWKPNFETQPWKVINTTRRTYLMKYYFEEISCSYKIAISDYENIWFEEIGESIFSDRAKVLKL